VDRKPSWEVAHLAYLVARRHGAGPRFIADVYRARWEDGRDISDRNTIAAIGGELGLPPDELRGAVDDPSIREEGLAALLSIHTDDVFGVPYFLYRRERYWGLDRLPDFVTAVRESGPAGRTPTPAGFVDAVAGHEAAADQGHAGGCG
jgi:2-hydroxychromene-2-carboxylate isomerase